MPAMLRDVVVQSVKWNRDKDNTTVDLGPLGPWNADTLTALGAMIGAAVRFEFGPDFAEALKKGAFLFTVSLDPGASERDFADRSERVSQAIQDALAFAESGA